MVEHIDFELVKDKNIGSCNVFRWDILMCFDISGETIFSSLMFSAILKQSKNSNNSTNIIYHPLEHIFILPLQIKFIGNKINSSFNMKSKYCKLKIEFE